MEALGGQPCPTLRPTLREFTTDDGSSVLDFSNHEWTLRVDVGTRLDPCLLYNHRAQAALADEAYCYEVTLAASQGPGFSGPEQTCQRVTPDDWTTCELGDGQVELRVRGRLDFGSAGPTDLLVEHAFRLPDSGGDFEERVSLVHQYGRDTHAITHYRFAFRKVLYDRTAHCWRDAADQAQLIPVPFRRWRGLSIDHRMASYSAGDLPQIRWRPDQLPGRPAEAWLWAVPESGFVVAKYAQHHIEFGVADGDPYSGDADVAPNTCLRFGGAGAIWGAPGVTRALEPGRDRLDFGATVIRWYEGTWQDGYDTFKQLMRDRGHVAPADFDPPVHWNELYNLGYRMGPENAPLQEPAALFAEAARARSLGAEALYLDPLWDLYEGSSVWDEERLGPLDDFVQRLRDEYGLALALHVMVHTKALADDPAVYRRQRDGQIAIWQGRYSGGYVCTASPVWQRLKIERLSTLAEAGVAFFMFDFLGYAPHDQLDGWTTGVSNPHRPAGPSACWSTDHGHTVPLTLEEHCEGIKTVIDEIKKRHPHVLVEMHDRITSGVGDYLPLYYQHGAPGSFDEHWGFEFMWDPYLDLLSGRALSLYEYNLAYDIPLYLHINCDRDNPHLLAFWWYASTCRHLGIGGVTEDHPLWPALTQAMARYLRLKNHFVHGDFIGIDTLTHIHALPGDPGSAVITAFNTSSTPKRLEITLPLKRLRITRIDTVAGATPTHTDQELRLVLDIPPLAPTIVEING